MKERIGPKIPCEAPEHVPGCACVGCQLPKPESCATCPKVNDDHFTPKSVAKLLGWSDRHVSPDETDEYRRAHPSVEDPENHQWLSIQCHNEKDKDTPLRKDILQRQLRGTYIPFEVHRQIFEAGNTFPLRVYEVTGSPMEPGVEYDLPQTRSERRRERRAARKQSKT